MTGRLCLSEELGWRGPDTSTHEYTVTISTSPFGKPRKEPESLHVSKSCRTAPYPDLPRWLLRVWVRWEVPGMQNEVETCPPGSGAIRRPGLKNQYDLLSKPRATSSDLILFLWLLFGFGVLLWLLFGFFAFLRKPKASTPTIEWYVSTTEVPRCIGNPPRDQGIHIGCLHILQDMTVLSEWQLTSPALSTAS